MDTESLRELADDVYDIDHRQAVPAWRAMHAAADEIERLRHELQRLDAARAAGYEAGVADERARWRWPEPVG